MYLALLFVIIYVAGVPIFVFFSLWCNKKHLYNEKSPKHLEIKFELGGLYQQYEPKYWWFELCNILTKMLMTGALCIVTPGSPIQLVTAISILATHMIIVLKLAPYQADIEDWMSFISS